VLFNSFTFVVFFCVVFTIHRLTPNATAQKRILLVASYVFYAAWNPPYVAILLFSTSLDWWLARRIWLSQDAARRKRLLIVSLLCNLGLLGFFKYSGFVLENFSAVLAALGVAYHPPAWDIVLPIGISFYTFASLSYTIDVYRREIRGDYGSLDYALFVSFFPHLVAGPIVRASVLLPQIAQPRHASANQVSWGLALTCIGLFSKVVLADTIFAPVVESVYAAPASFGAVDVWAAVLGFSGQIYFDFSGYSLCAIGLALCFGFEFPDNFRYPYAARGFSDFWRRWHITLSTWLRDYLYVPLGGNRGSEFGTYRNLMLTMLIGGLWHGASWVFVMWGGLHGLYLAIERALRGRRLSHPNEPQGPAIGLTLLTFLVVTLTWIPFRSANLHGVLQMFEGLLRFGTPGQLEPIPMVLCYLTVATTLAWHFILRDSSLAELFSKLGHIPQMAAMAFCLIAMFLCSGGDERAFIYFLF
jgi:alginate O-acetyltransferase complex protein AlgI